MSQELALRAVGLSKSFGAFLANDHIDLAVPKGSRHALIGPNGAGKTTFVNLLTGRYRASAGEVYLAGERVTALPEHARVRRGMARTFQINALFPQLNVFESILLAVCESRGRSGAWWRRLSRLADEQREAWTLLERLRLAGDAAVLTEHLPYGKRRLLELALALATRPRVLLLDEPASGIPAPESRDMFEVIAALPRDVTLLFIEHDMGLVFRFAERISVLSAGRVLSEGTPEQIRSDPRVRDVYLGGALP
ncbi:MAG TPA: ABC transporter ATP-binding protein [Polyangiaceae bacterium]|nr:ABC transporter ATP-binding protein [Polyangiaceae bacterium]